MIVKSEAQSEGLELLRQELLAAKADYAEARAVIFPQIRALENELRDHRNKCSAFKSTIGRLERVAERAQERAQERLIVKAPRFSLLDLLLSGEGSTANYQFYSKSGRELNVSIFLIEIDIEGLPLYGDKSLCSWEDKKLQQSGLEWIADNMPGLDFEETYTVVREGMVTIRSIELAKLKAAYDLGGTLTKIWVKFKKSGRNTYVAWENIFVVEKTHGEDA